MFKKIDVKRRSVINGSTRKKLRERFLEQFPGQDPFVGDAEWKAVKLSGRTIVYTRNGDPFFFDPEERGRFVPALHGLRHLPALVPRIAVAAPALAAIMQGADVMLPGVYWPYCAGIGDGSTNTAADICGKSSSGGDVSTLLNGKGEENGVASGDDGNSDGNSDSDGDSDGDGDDLARDTDIAREIAAAFASLAVSGRETPTGTIVQVVTTARPDVPVAVGELVVPGSLVREGGKGKCVVVWHVLQDALFREGARGKFPTPEELMTGRMTDDKNGGNGNDADDAGSSAVAKDPTEGLSMDDLVTFAFFAALVTRIEDDMLPMHLNTFFSNHLLLCKPEGTRLDIKKTSWKKVGVMADRMHDDGVIDVIERKEGVMEISAVHRTHDRIIEFCGAHGYEDVRPGKGQSKPTSPLAIAAAAGAAAAASESGNGNAGSGSSSTSGPSGSGSGQPGGGCAKRKVTVMHRITQPVQQLFVALGVQDKSVLLTAPQIEQMLQSYASQAGTLRGSGKKRQVALDRVLQESLFRKDGVLESEVPFSDVLDRTLSKMSPCYRVDIEGDPAPVHFKGKVPKVSVEVTKRMGNKMVTKVCGVEHFAVDLADFAVLLSRVCAASAAVKPASENKQGGGPFVLCQGSVHVEVCEQLTNRFGIDKSLITVSGDIKKRKGKGR